MKKLLALLLAMMMVFALAACGGNEENPSGSNDNTPGNSEQQDEQPSNTDDGGGNSGSDASAEWPDNKWTNLLPEPTDGKITGLKEKDDGKGYTISVTEWTQEIADAYMQAVMDAGFNIDSPFGDMEWKKVSGGQYYRFNAQNSDGVRIEMTFDPEKGSGQIRLTTD